MCSYCGCEAITLIGRFMGEHVEISNALSELRTACHDGDGERTRAAAATMAGLLTPHTHAEEVGLFAVMREDETFTDHIDSLCGEHRSIDALLSRIAAGEFAGFAEFEHVLHHHIEREDNGLFPAAHIAMSGEDWTRIDALTPGAGP